MINLKRKEFQILSGPNKRGNKDVKNHVGTLACEPLGEFPHINISHQEGLISKSSGPLAGTQASKREAL